jgi:hypothetical protein
MAAGTHDTDVFLLGVAEVRRWRSPLVDTTRVAG